MLHKLVRSLAAILLGQFYSRIRVKGAPIVSEGGVLFVANHPNYLMDSLIVATQVGRPVSFLAKSTLFANPALATLLRRLKVVPIQRRGEGSNVEENKKVFSAVSSALNAGEAITLFPEGVSKGERKISPLKTGAARMAFQALDESDWQTPIQIQSLGITYSDFGVFRSSITVIVSPAIQVHELKARYEEEEREAVRQLTSQIEDTLREVTVEVESDAHVDLVESISKLYALAQSDDIDDHQRMEAVSQNVMQLAPQDPEKAELLLKRISALLDTVKDYGLDLDDMVESRKSKLFVLLIAPLILLGELIHYLPYKVVGVIAPRLCRHHVERASRKLLLGLFLFPLWSLLLSFLAWLATCSLATGVLVFCICLISGYFVSFYLHHFRILLWELLPGNFSALRKIREERDELLSELESLRIV